MRKVAALAIFVAAACDGEQACDRTVSPPEPGAYVAESWQCAIRGGDRCEVPEAIASIESAEVRANAIVIRWSEGEVVIDASAQGDCLMAPGPAEIDGDEVGDIYLCDISCAAFIQIDDATGAAYTSSGLTLVDGEWFDAGLH